ncbi:MAG: RNA polymerase sigma factor, partial [Dehalococcoidia bacterium]
MTSNVSAAQEAALVASASAGDQDAIGELYNRYFDRVYDFVHRLMRDADEAADVVQEVFVKAMSSMSSLIKSDRFRSWLFSIA